MSNNSSRYDFLLANDGNDQELPREIGTGATIVAASVGLIALGAPIVAAYYARKASVAATAALNAVNAVQQQETTPKE